MSALQAHRGAYFGSLYGSKSRERLVDLCERLAIMNANDHRSRHQTATTVST